VLLLCVLSVSAGSTHTHTHTHTPCRLVAVLHSRAYVYELQTLDLLRIIDTHPNPLGTSCLSCGPNGGSLLALPADPVSGMLRCVCVCVCALMCVFDVTPCWYV